MIYTAVEHMRSMRTTHMMNISRRTGRVRLRSATSQLPDDSPTWRVPCVKMKTAMWYLVWIVVIGVILSLNNLVLLYIQHSGRSPANQNLPTTQEHTAGSAGVRKPLHIVPTVPTLMVEMPDKAPVKKAGAQREIMSSAKPPSKSYTEDSETTPNELLKESAIVIINSHSACQMKQVLQTMKQDYPDIPIYIESTDMSSPLCNQEERITCIKPPSWCRNSCVYNHLIHHVDGEEYPYIFVWDARFSYTESHTLALLAKRFVETRARIVSPCVKDYCNSTTGTLHKSQRTGELTAIPGIHLPSNMSNTSPTCHLSDLLPPVFLATHKTLTSTELWDDRLTSGLHADFLLTVQHRKLAVAACKDIEITFNGTCQASQAQRSSFSDEWLYLPPEGFKKWNITKVYNGLGRSYYPMKGETTFEDMQWKPVDLNSRNGTVDRSLQHAVIENVNDRTPGWKNIRSKSSNSSKLTYMYTSPCIMRVQGSLHIEYDRHSSFKNEESDIQVDLHHHNRSCHMFQDYWQLRRYGKLVRKQVYYVTAVGNDTEFMERLLSMINSQYEKNFTNLVIVDMSRPGPEQFNLTKYKLNIRTHYLHLGAPFSRSIGLKKGFEFAQQLASRRPGHDNPILFSIDTSMIIPYDFTRRVWKSTRCGVSTYAPICYKEKSEGSGYWVNTGYGMVGVCASDYNLAGGWDPKWGYHWGAEDVDLINRILKHTPYIVRIREDRYKHVHSGENRKNAKTYYKNKNIYGEELPVTPLTKHVTDSAIKKSLYEFAVKRMKYPVTLHLKTVYKTTLPQSTGVLYDLKFVNDINEEYYALIQSV